MPLGTGKLFSFNETAGASLSSPRYPSPHGLILPSAALSNDEMKSMPDLRGSPSPGLWGLDQFSGDVFFCDNSPYTFVLSQFL